MMATRESVDVLVHNISHTDFLVGFRTSHCATTTTTSGTATGTSASSSADGHGRDVDASKRREYD